MTLREAKRIEIGDRVFHKETKQVFTVSEKEFIPSGCGYPSNTIMFSFEETEEKYAHDLIKKIDDPENTKTSYGIQISYSWGEEEPIYDGFETKEKAYEEACRLAGQEGYVQNEEFDEDRTCYIYMNAAEYAVDLHYDVDNEWCYYRVVEVLDE